MIRRYSDAMKKLFLMLHDESGQDLVEYAMVVCLIATAATFGMSDVAVKINTAFTNIGAKITTSTT
jgi:pilus assembly protein Flp/PilA